MDKVAIYCRLSDEDRDKCSSIDESESIQNQKSMLINYALERGWEIYKIYCEACGIIGLHSRNLVKSRVSESWFYFFITQAGADFALIKN